MRHPLIREVFNREARLIYPGRFREFIEKNRASIEKPVDPDAF